MFPITPTFARLSAFAASAIMILAVAACGSTTPELTALDNQAITNVSVVDVATGTILPDQTVIIEDGVIMNVGPSSEIQPARGAHVIDGQGLYLTPGLIDAHVHFFDPAIFGRMMIANGVLLVRDMGQATGDAIKLRDALNRGDLLGPEMIVTGAMLDGNPPVIPPISVGLDTPDAARAAVRQQAEAGVDQIKVYSRLDKDVFLAIVDEAAKAGLKVVGHVPDSIPIEEAAAAGMKSAEHFFGLEKVIVTLLGGQARRAYAGMGSEADALLRLDEIDPGALQAFYEQLRVSGLTICPTVVVYKIGTRYEAIKAGDFEGKEYISAGIFDLWRSQWAAQDDLPESLWQNWAQMVSGLNQAGIPLMVGTDLVTPGIIPGESVHQEMEIWQEAGIPPADVLRSATLTPARFMGLEDRLGSVAEGKAASLVLVRSNPLEDIRNTRLIEGVFFRDQYFNRDDLDRLLSEAKDLVRSE